MAAVTPDPDRFAVLSAYLDGELDDGELDEVIALLSEDPEAVAEFRRIRDTKRVLRALPVVEPPGWLLDVEHYGDRLSAYLDGELPTEEVTSIVHHLTTCRVCREELHDLDRSRIAVRALPGLDVPRFVAPPEPRPAASPEPERRRHRLRPRPVAAATIGLVAVLALLSILSPSASDPTITMSDLEARHIARVSIEPGFSVLPASVEAVDP